MDLTPGSREQRDVEHLLRMFAFLEEHEGSHPDHFTSGALADALGVNKRRVGQFLRRYFSVGLVRGKGYSAVALYSRWDAIKAEAGVKIHFGL